MMFVRVAGVHADGPPRPVGFLVLRRVRDQVAVLDVVGQRVVHFAELLVSRRKEEAPASFDGEMPEQPFALDGDAGDAADADDVDRRAGCAHGSQRVFVLRRAAARRSRR